MIRTQAERERQREEDERRLKHRQEVQSRLGKVSSAPRSLDASMAYMRLLGPTHSTLSTVGRTGLLDERSPFASSQQLRQQILSPWGLDFYETAPPPIHDLPQLPPPRLPPPPLSPSQLGFMSSVHRVRSLTELLRHSPLQDWAQAVAQVPPAPASTDGDGRQYHSLYSHSGRHRGHRRRHRHHHHHHNPLEPESEASLDREKETSPKDRKVTRKVYATVPAKVLQERLRAALTASKEDASAGQKMQPQGSSGAGHNNPESSLTLPVEPEQGREAKKEKPAAAAAAATAADTAATAQSAVALKSLSSGSLRRDGKEQPSKPAKAPAETKQSIQPHPIITVPLGPMYASSARSETRLRITAPKRGANVGRVTKAQYSTATLPVSLRSVVSPRFVAGRTKATGETDSSLVAHTHGYSPVATKDPATRRRSLSGAISVPAPRKDAIKPSTSSRKPLAPLPVRRPLALEKEKLKKENASKGSLSPRAVSHASSQHVKRQQKRGKPLKDKPKQQSTATQEGTAQEETKKPAESTTAEGTETKPPTEATTAEGASPKPAEGASTEEPSSKLVPVTKTSSRSWWRKKPTPLVTDSRSELSAASELETQFAACQAQPRQDPIDIDLPDNVKEVRLLLKVLMAATMRPKEAKLRRLVFDKVAPELGKSVKLLVALGFSPGVERGKRMLILDEPESVWLTRLKTMISLLYIVSGNIQTSALATIR